MWAMKYSLDPKKLDLSGLPAVFIKKPTHFIAVIKEEQ